MSWTLTRHEVNSPSTESASPEVPGRRVDEMRRSEEDRIFWADMPRHWWLLEPIGWPKGKPRHASHQEGWLVQLVLSIVFCAGLALGLLLIH